MSGRRGRPRKPLPVHPNRVLSQAIKKGLATAVTIQGRIKNRITRHLYESSKKIWRTATKRYGASPREFHHIIDAENNIRKNGLQMLFEKAAAYGNTEVSRVKRSDDTIGPLNQRFNIAGAILRDFALAMYPFPDPIELSSGRVGYPKSSHGPEVVPIHAIPELDFIDCVRQHVQVLCTHCYIFDVPNRDTGRYTNLFLLRVRPYLDRIYSEGEYGLKDFRTGTMRVLREVKNEITKIYNVRSGVKSTVTSQIEFEPPKFTIDFFKKQIEDAENTGVPSIIADEIERLLDGGSLDRDENDDPLPCLTERDVGYIWSLASRRARKRGSQVHRQLLTQFPSFWDIRRAILNNGDVDSEDGYILCSETDIDTEAGSARTDILLLRREATYTGLRAVWRPVLLLDLKSKLGFHWSLSHMEKSSESRKRHGLPQRVVPDFIIQTRPLDETEWKSVIKSTPNDKTRGQVYLYANAIAKAYEESTDEPCPDIPVGTLVVDAETGLRDLRSILRQFIIEVYESLPDQAADYSRTAFQFQSESTSPRAAIIVHQQRISSTSNRTPLPPVWKPPFDPLQGASSRKGRFLLNIAAKAPTSSGTSAARISNFWHGMELLSQLTDEIEEPKIVWLDLADEYIEPFLAEIRLYLRPRSNSEAERYKNHPREISELFKSISVYGVFKEIHDYLFKANQHALKHLSKIGREHIVVVSGWDWLQKATPEPYRVRLNELLAKLLDRLPDANGTTVVWFDSAVPDQSSSSVYSTRTVLPFYPNSPLFGEVTEIVWNLPLAPRSEIYPEDWNLSFDPISPCYDEIRVILHQRRNRYNAELTQIPPLINWSKKFRAEKTRLPFETIGTVTAGVVPDSKSRTRMRDLSLSLMPWFTKLYLSTIIRDEAVSSLDIRSASLGETSGFEPSLLERMRLHPGSTKDGMSYIPLTMGRINSQRSYRSPRELTSSILPSYQTESETVIEQTRVSFGQVIALPQSDSHKEIIVCEDPYSPGRLLFGMFTESSTPSDSGYIWTRLDAPRLEDITSSDHDDLEIRYLSYTETERGLACWEKDAEDSEWSPQGIVDLIAGQGGRFAVLSGIRVTPDSLSDFDKPTLQFPEDFEFRTRSLIQRIRSASFQSKFVTVKLVEDGSLCRIVFHGSEEDDAIHHVEIQGTSDVISLLRHPLIQGRSLQTPSGQSITWNLFSDIEYENFGIIRSLIETSAPREARKFIAPIATDNLQPADESIEIVLKHIRDACPLVANIGHQHEACWSIIPSLDAASEPFDSLHTGKEIYGHLSTGRIKIDDSVYLITLNLGHTKNESDFYAYHEDRWIRRLLRENDIHFKQLTPGTFLRISEEKWNLDFTIHKNVLEWIAVSEVTDFPLEGTVFGYRLNPTLNLDESMQDIIADIELRLPIERIANLENFKMLLSTRLESSGYSTSSPECYLEVTSEQQALRIKLIQIGGKSHIVLSEEAFLIENDDSKDEFLNALHYRLDEGDLSSFNITNTGHFLEELKRHLAMIS